ncbi:MAG: endolytic transglycosylase MltG [Clostridia bacterium]|nr:endolytic transglycosylase MltG [Clostridia bacterium]
MSTLPPNSAPIVERTRVKRVRFWKTGLLITILFFIFVVFAGISVVHSYLAPCSEISHAVHVSIPAGSTTKEIGDLLTEKGLIKNSLFFQSYTRFLQLDQNLKAGDYTLDPSWDLEKIVDTLTKGQVSYLTFTIPEGYNLKQIAKKVEEKGLASQEEFFRTLKEGSFNYEFLSDPGLENNSLEGFLFPDTYKIRKNASAHEIIHMMLKRFDEIYTDDYRLRAQELGLSTLQVVTLASIIEKEAKLDHERPIISGVFHNRLRKNWRLESCATVQYLLDEPKEELLLQDLQIESPYNTYRHSGLPPGPIASPGKASLEAALFPAEVDYLFFVARKDGSHVFSRTLAEHNQAKRLIAMGKL